MTSELRYTLEGRPVPWQRAKSTGKRRYTDPAMKAAQASHRWLALAARPRGWLDTGDFVIEVVAYVHPMQRADSDNLGKLVKDALQRVAYRHDGLVSRDAFERRVDRERPRTEVVVRRLEAAR